MLPLNTGLQVSEQRIADGIGAARNGLEQTAAADNDIQRLGVAVLFLQEVKNDLLAEILLINNAGILGDLLGRVTQRFFKQQGLILKHTDLGGGGAGIDDQSFDGHWERLLFYILWFPPRGAIFYWFSPAATTAASAMELTFVWKESLRLVRMAGTLVPVRMQPFLQSAV